MRHSPTEPTGKLARSFEGSSTVLLKKGNCTSSSLNTHVTVLVRALSQLAKFFFSWKLLMHIQRCKLECVPFTGKKLITCNSCLWHSSPLVSSLSSGKRRWFLMVTSFVFWCVCTNNMIVYISDKGILCSWAFILTLKFKRLKINSYSLNDRVLELEIMFRQSSHLTNWKKSPREAKKFPQDHTAQAGNSLVIVFFSFLQYIL